MPSSELRSTTTRTASATCSPFWLVTLVVTVISVMAPPFFCTTSATSDRNVSTSPTTTGAW